MVVGITGRVKGGWAGRRVVVGCEGAGRSIAGLYLPLVFLFGSVKIHQRARKTTQRKRTQKKKGGTGGKEEPLQTIFYSRAD